jgi:hypothetical protein
MIKLLDYYKDSENFYLKFNYYENGDLKNFYSKFKDKI